MKSLLLSFLILPLCLAATTTLSKQQQLSALAGSNNGVIKLNTATYDLLTSSKRNWSASIQFTAMDQRRRCAPCKEFGPSFDAVAKAWSTVPQAVRDTHFFGTLDFDEAPTVFQKLNLATAPVVYVFPPTEGPRQPSSGKVTPSKYDFTNGFDALPLAEHLSNHTPVPIPYKAPIDWTRYGSYAVTGLVLLITLRFVRPILQNRWVWAVGTVLTSVIMTSGYMFNRIRGTPFQGPKGAFVAAGFQTQYGQETQFVAMIYGSLALSFLMLIIITPYQSSPARQRAQVYIWSTIIMIIYSVLVALFKVKNRGYPFKLFL